MSQNGDGPPVSPHDRADSSDEASGDDDHDRIAPKETRKRPEREWELIGEWNPATEDKAFIDAEIAHIAKEKMAEGGISKLHSIRAKVTDLSLWKERDVWPQQASSATTGLIRYRCPFSSSMKCQALLKIERRDNVVLMFMSRMHTNVVFAKDDFTEALLKI